MFAPSTRILVVDDMMTMRKLVIKACKTMGFSSFEEAADGRLGWEKLNQTDPPIELVICDWNMPNATGLDLLRRIRSDSRFKTLPFILVTAEADRAQVIEAVQAGVSNYVVKPFTPDQLKEKLESAYKKTKG
jgi:two-component system, chemotaxis family, chemotaxis protein CheY